MSERRQRRLHIGGYAALAVVAFLLGGCQGDEDALQERMASWNAEVVRYSWSCPSLGLAMQQWLDRNAEDLAEEVDTVRSKLDEAPDDEREEILARVRGYHTIPAAAAIAKCSGDERVHAQLRELYRVLQPLLIDEEPPIPEKDVAEEPKFLNPTGEL